MVKEFLYRGIPKEELEKVPLDKLFKLFKTSPPKAAYGLPTISFIILGGAHGNPTKKNKVMTFATRKPFLMNK